MDRTTPKQELLDIIVPTAAGLVWAVQLQRRTAHLSRTGGLARRTRPDNHDRSELVESLAQDLDRVFAARHATGGDGLLA
jgi:hypothetical protein